jgi:hypothetical protein
VKHIKKEKKISKCGRKRKKEAERGMIERK